MRSLVYIATKIIEPKTGSVIYCSENLTTTTKIFQLAKHQVFGQVDRTPVTKTVDSGSISGRAKPKTIKIGIHSFPARRSASKDTA